MGYAHMGPEGANGADGGVTMTQVPLRLQDCECGHNYVNHLTEETIVALWSRLSWFAYLFRGPPIPYCTSCRSQSWLWKKSAFRHEFKARVVPCHICGANLMVDSHYHPDWPMNDARTP